jgi:hypothetical protein
LTGTGTAPNSAVAMLTSTNSMSLRMMIATRSPGSTPRSTSPAAIRCARLNAEPYHLIRPTTELRPRAASQRDIDRGIK